MSWSCRCVSVAAEREERRCWSAIVCPFTALQGSQEEDQRCKDQAGLLLQLVKKKIRVCAMLCTKPMQQVLTLPWQHSWTCRSPKHTRWWHAKGAEGQCTQPPPPAGIVHITVQTQQRNNSKISTTSSRRNLGKKGWISQTHFQTLTST